MKATLMFDLPGEQEEFHQASTDSQLEAVEQVREVFYECCGRWME